MIANWWNLAYLFRPPWDSGEPTSVLVRLVESGEVKPGRAIDLGCGTGTNAIYLAQHGFEVTGVDLAPRAIAKAQRKAQAAGVQVRWLVGDVTALPADLGPFDFALDIGCFHSLPLEMRRAYVKTLRRVLAPDGRYLLWCFLREDHRDARRGGNRLRPGPRGLTLTELETHFGTHFAIQTFQPPQAGWRTTAVYLMEHLAGREEGA